jgi:hypothetical protein
MRGLLAIGVIVVIGAALLIFPMDDSATLSRPSITNVQPSPSSEMQQDGVSTEAPSSLPLAGFKPRGEPIVFHGNLSMMTQPFTLAAGNYVVQWEATPGATAGCFHGGYLRAVDGSYSEDFGGHGPGVGSTLADAVTPGTYYADAVSGCAEWTIVIARL